MRVLGFILILGMSITSFAKTENTPVHGYTDAQLKEMSDYNKAQAQRSWGNPLTRALGFRGNSDRLPYAEFEEAGYLVFSDDDYYGMAKHIKIALAEHLPSDVTLVVYTDSSSKSHQKQLATTYGQYVPAERLKIVQVSNRGSYFWARDGLPVPTWNNVSTKPVLGMVDAKYYHNFESDKEISQMFGADLVKLGYYFEGGNFVVNSRGDCLVVNRYRPPSITANIPDEAFINQYGCKRLIRLPYLKGIGHADEVVKFMNDDLVFTDTHEYKQTLEDAGFTVQMLPEPKRKYETYANSLQVNDVVYVPTFDDASVDQQAVAMYEALGLNVVPIYTTELATRGQGGIHCITMTYPKGPFTRVLRKMNGRVVN